MDVNGPGKTRSTSPLVGATGPIPPAVTPNASGKIGTDGLKLSRAAGPSAAKDLASIEQAALPKRGMMMITHGQQDAWASKGADVLKGAYDALQRLEANQQDPLKAVSESQMAGARAKFKALGNELVAHDPRNVRRGVVEDQLRELSQGLRGQMEVGEPPARGAMTKEQWAQAKTAWVAEKGKQLDAVRPTLDAMGKLDDAFHQDSHAWQMSKMLDEKKASLATIANPPPTNWGKLVGDIVRVGSAVAHEANMNAHAVPIGPIAVRPDGQVIAKPQ